MQNELQELFLAYFKHKPLECEAIKAHASSRKIYRISSKTNSAIGVANSDIRENETFIYFSQHFHRAGLPVPEIYGVHTSKRFYLQEDLGNQTLYDILFAQRSDHDPLPHNVERLYSEALLILPRFQLEASHGIDYSLTHKFASFGYDSILSDMHYFRDQFLDRVAADYDKDLLELDFKKFAEYLSKTDSNYFMLRDLQSRNIMVKEEKLYFIDYQGGCQGPLQYDVASLLFQAQARLPNDARERLLTAYLNSLENYIQFDRHAFLTNYYGFVVLRIMQALGTYGLRGLKEKRQYFIDSIDFALVNLLYVYRTQGLPIPMPEFERFIVGLKNVKEEKLTLTIYSFSYKLGTQTPFNPHGGGYVFDCRCLPNPGREVQYKTKSGLDTEVKDYLQSKPEVAEFFDRITGLVGQAAKNYIERKFSNLSVAFGCTGGQHRSVYLAEKLAEYIKKNFDVNVLVHHLSRDLWVKTLPSNNS